MLEILQIKDPLIWLKIHFRLLPLMAKIVISIIPVILAAATTIFAYCQHKLDKTRLKLEAYDRRLKVYDALKKFVANILTTGEVHYEDSKEMLRETKHAHFLFKETDEILTFIDELYNKGCLLELKEKQIQSSENASQRNKLLKESNELKNWFKSQFNTIDTKFRPYLQL